MQVHVKGDVKGDNRSFVSQTCDVATVSAHRLGLSFSLYFLVLF